MILEIQCWETVLLQFGVTLWRNVPVRVSQISTFFQEKQILSENEPHVYMEERRWHLTSPFGGLYQKLFIAQTGISQFGNARGLPCT